MHTHNIGRLTPAECRLGRRRSWTLYQLAERKLRSASQPPSPAAPAITISYQTGSGEHEVARLVADILQTWEANESARWAVLDGQLVERTLAEHHLPKTLARLMPEDSRSFINDIVEEVIGLRPPSWIILPQICETIHHLADAGHIIMVGRGANFVTARMPNVFHVRLIASLPRRIARVQRVNHLASKEAAKYVAERDRGRRRYVKAHFQARSEDELHYHCVINTDKIPCPVAARLIADAARNLFGGCRTFRQKQASLS